MRRATQERCTMKTQGSALAADPLTIRARLCASPGGGTRLWIEGPERRDKLVLRVPDELSPVPLQQADERALEAVEGDVACGGKPRFSACCASLGAGNRPPRDWALFQALMSDSSALSIHAATPDRSRGPRPCSQARLVRLVKLTCWLLVSSDVNEQLS